MSAFRVGIIGGGASGVFAALSVKEQNRHIQCTIFESASELLDKVKISGGGRCNVTHNCFEVRELIQKYPRGGKELQSLFYRFQPEDIIDWFESRGVELKAEDDGRMFPVTDSSQTIIDCFLDELQKNQVEIKYNSRIASISKSDSKFKILDLHDNEYEFDAVVLATGSSKYGLQFAESFGHTIIKPVPSLFTFKINDTRIKDLSGVSVSYVETRLEVGGEKFKEQGPLLITHWGLSGPAILKLSAFAARELHESRYKAELIINLLPGYSEDDISTFFQKQKAESPKKIVYNLHPHDIPKRLWHSLLQYLAINETLTFNQISAKMIQQIMQQLHNARFTVGGKGVFKEEFVTAGGISLKEIDFKTMQSKQCANLYFCGEILDIDGITGGFNFQNAWSTGYVAGCSILKSD
ncbi:MAG: NAD(P)/FAD-dependent oxidoreductase [Calditrichaeota bacterium]|nr:MAG: NAD(P)/FAD-dependent oxidoreductase [Calditrichota bacterium]